MKVVILILVVFVFVGSSCTPDIDVGYKSYAYTAVIEFDENSDRDRHHNSNDVIKIGGMIILDKDSVHLKGESTLGSKSFKIKGYKRAFMGSESQYLCVCDDESYIMLIDAYQTYIEIQKGANSTKFCMNEIAYVPNSFNSYNSYSDVESRDENLDVSSTSWSDTMGRVFLWPETDTIASFMGSRDEEELEDNLARFVEHYEDRVGYNGQRGFSLVKFVIDTNGNVTNGKVYTGNNDEVNAFALECLKAMPDWKPAIFREEHVRMTYSLEVEMY